MKTGDREKGERKGAERRRKRERQSNQARATARNHRAGIETAESTMKCV